MRIAADLICDGTMAPIGMAWAAGLVALLATARRVARSARPDLARRLASGEDGAAYTLSYVMALPFYLGLIAAVAETSLMIVAKTGTVYAAFSGARTAAVRTSPEGAGDAERAARRAAIRSFVPFASARATSRPAEAAVAESGEAKAYLRAYRDSDARPGTVGYVRAKFAEAEAALRVRVEQARGSDPDGWDDEVRVEVTYPYPFNFPFLGRLLGQAGPGGGRVYPISSGARLQAEVPHNPGRSLGISYGSP